MNKSKKITVGLVGFGLSSSTLHAPSILKTPGFDLAAVVSSNHEKVSSQLKQVQVFPTIDNMLHKIDLDLIVVATPNHTHYELTKTCLQHNKHTIVEKPFVLNKAQAQELIQIAQQKGLILCTYQNRRWDSAVVTLRKLIRENALGKIYQCNFHFDRYRPIVKKLKWKELNVEGAGALYDIGPHLIDHALCFFGMPKSIQADIALQREDAEVADYFHILLSYEKTKVMLHSSSVSLGDVPCLQVHGEKGSYTYYEERDENYSLEGIRIPNKAFLKLHDNGIIKNTTLGAESTDYQQYYKKLYRSIVNVEPPPVSLEDMLKNITLMELALQSYKTGQRIYL